jgi:hypothetical protein
MMFCLSGPLVKGGCHACVTGGFYYAAYRFESLHRLRAVPLPLTREALTRIRRAEAGFVPRVSAPLPPLARSPSPKWEVGVYLDKPYSAASFLNAGSERSIMLFDTQYAMRT